MKVDLESAELARKTLFVVGGTSGLGRAIAIEAASNGCTVTVVGRFFQNDPGIKFVQADLSEMKTAKSVGETVEAAEVVLFTTGIVPKVNAKSLPRALK